MLHLLQQVCTSLARAQSWPTEAGGVHTRTTAQRRHLEAGILGQGQAATPPHDRLRLLDGIVQKGLAILHHIRRRGQVGERQQIQLKPREESLDLDELAPILGPDDEGEAQGDPPR